MAIVLLYEGFLLFHSIICGVLCLNNQVHMLICCSVSVSELQTPFCSLVTNLLVKM